MCNRVGDYLTACPSCQDDHNRFNYTTDTQYFSINHPVYDSWNKYDQEKETLSIKEEKNRLNINDIKRLLERDEDITIMSYSNTNHYLDEIITSDIVRTIYVRKLLVENYILHQECKNIVTHFIIRTPR